MLELYGEEGLLKVNERVRVLAVRLIGVLRALWQLDVGRGDRGDARVVLVVEGAEHLGVDRQEVLAMDEARARLEVLCEDRVDVVAREAAELHEQAETFRVLIGNLQLISHKYNTMHSTLIEVEKPLLERELRSMDTLLEQVTLT